MPSFGSNPIEQLGFAGKGVEHGYRPRNGFRLPRRSQSQPIEEFVPRNDHSRHMSYDIGRFDSHSHQQAYRGDQVDYAAPALGHHGSSFGHDNSFGHQDLKSRPASQPLPLSHPPSLSRSRSQNHQPVPLMPGMRMHRQSSNGDSHGAFPPLSGTPEAHYSFDGGVHGSVESRIVGGVRAGKQRSDSRNSRSGSMDAFCESLTPDMPFQKFSGCLFELSQSQKGCRFLQMIVTTRGKSICLQMLNELRSKISLLMVDPFGNYLFQKLVENLPCAYRLQILQDVVGTNPNALFQASLNLHGTRSVQKLVEVCSDDPDQSRILVTALSAHITKLSLDTNGNHVIQRFLRHMPGERSQFVHDTVLRDILIITRHRHGCCVFQRCIDAATDEQRKPLMDVIVHNAEKFIQDPFGNYVVQYVLERANADDVRMIASKLLGRLASLSMQKFSSNVVEKALQIAPGEVQQDMISELIDKKTLRSLLRDQFGNYVMQRALLASPKEQVHDVVDAISPHMTELFSTHPASARRLASRLLKINPNALPQNLYVRMVDSGAHSKQR